MIARKHLNGTLHLHCLSCLYVTYNTNFPLGGQESWVTGPPSHHTVRMNEGLNAWSRVLPEKLTGSQIVRKIPRILRNPKVH